MSGKKRKLCERLTNNPLSKLGEQLCKILNLDYINYNPEVINDIEARISGGKWLEEALHRNRGLPLDLILEQLNWKDYAILTLISKNVVTAFQQDTENREALCAKIFWINTTHNLTLWAATDEEPNKTLANCPLNLNYLKTLTGVELLNEYTFLQQDCKVWRIDRISTYATIGRHFLFNSIFPLATTFFKGTLSVFAYGGHIRAKTGQLLYHFEGDSTAEIISGQWSPDGLHLLTLERRKNSLAEARFNRVRVFRFLPSAGVIREVKTEIIYTPNYAMTPQVWISNSDFIVPVPIGYDMKKIEIPWDVVVTKFSLCNSTYSKETFPGYIWKIAQSFGIHTRAFGCLFIHPDCPELAFLIDECPKHFGIHHRIIQLNWSTSKVQFYVVPGLIMEVKNDTITSSFFVLYRPHSMYDFDTIDIEILQSPNCHLPSPWISKARRTPYDAKRLKLICCNFSTNICEHLLTSNLKNGPVTQSIWASRDTAMEAKRAADTLSLKKICLRLEMSISRHFVGVISSGNVFTHLVCIFFNLFYSILF